MFADVLAYRPSLAAALILGGLVIVAYEIYINRRERHHPGSGTQALNALARTRWVESIMREGRRDVLAVQTLRNSVMAASIMASTAILLVIGTLNLGAEGARLEAMLGAFAGRHSAASAGDHALIVLLLLADFFVAFFMFSMAIRFYNHVGYMINLPPAESPAFPP
ncbi:MAG TPA: DUF599 domain-containing protein, partial [Hyphomicrobiaceae bacterium]|nr:DUF599 domain-containing protein [Hyphomicrobiaceae bacterium]